MPEKLDPMTPDEALLYLIDKASTGEIPHDAATLFKGIMHPYCEWREERRRNYNPDGWNHEFNVMIFVTASLLASYAMEVAKPGMAKNITQTLAQQVLRQINEKPQF